MICDFKHGINVDVIGLVVVSLLCGNKYCLVPNGWDLWLELVFAPFLAPMSLRFKQAAASGCGKDPWLPPMFVIPSCTCSPVGAVMSDESRHGNAVDVQHESGCWER